MVEVLAMQLDTFCHHVKLGAPNIVGFLGGQTEY
jgi:hypothetical protein